MHGVRIAFAAGLAVTAASVAVVLSRSPPTVVRDNYVPADHRLAATEGGGALCQANEALPASTSAIRLSLVADLGPEMHLDILSAGREVASGERGAGWGGGSVTVRIRPPQSTLPHATVCVSFTGANERVSLWGSRTAANLAATSGQTHLPGRIRIEYLAPGHSSWWSLALSVARRLGLGRAWAGTWIALLVLMLTGTAATLALWLGARELR